MKRVIIVPVTETGQFSGMEILASGGSIAALVGDTFEERTRSAFDSDDSFFYSVAGGRADLYTFNTLEEAARFAKCKIEASLFQTKDEPEGWGVVVLWKAPFAVCSG